MKERPILFSGPMVRAILEGRKWMTRRVVKPQPESYDPATGRVRIPGVGTGPVEHLVGPFCVGDRLWVKETHQRCGNCAQVNYRADSQKFCSACDAGLGKWRPSIFMFREYSRITLEVSAVRVERLQDISAADAEAEGVEYNRGPTRWGITNPRLAFCRLWESINGPGSWQHNPWVWVVQFAVIPQSDIQKEARHAR